MLTPINSALRIEVQEWNTPGGAFQYRFLLLGNSGVALACGPWRHTNGAAQRDAQRMRRAIAAPPHWSQISSGDAGPVGEDPQP